MQLIEAYELKINWSLREKTCKQLFYAVIIRNDWAKVLRSYSGQPNPISLTMWINTVTIYPICPGYGPLLYSALTPKWPITVRTLCLFRLAQFEWTCHIVKVLIHCIFSSILFNWRYSTYVGALEKDLPLTEILLDEEDSYPQLTKSWKLNLEHAVG